VVVARLEAMLGATVTKVVVQQTDLVRDLTVVDVRYRLPRRAVGDIAIGRALTGQEPVGSWRTVGVTNEQ
jgi:hypothetical protein